MNPNALIDQSTGRIIPAAVLRQAHVRAASLAKRGPTYRTALSFALAEKWSIARDYAGYWQMRHSTAPRAMPFTGGRQIDGTMHERSV